MRSVPSCLVMPPRDAPATEPQTVRDAFSSFEESLRAMLTTEAQKSVEDALERLSSESQAFQVTDISVDVRIDRLNVSTGGGAVKRRAKSKPRSEGSSGSPRSGTRRRGRPGKLRELLLDAFPDGEQELTTKDLLRYLQDLGVEASTPNVHQHLARLVKAGELRRPKHGAYIRIGPR